MNPDEIRLIIENWAEVELKRFGFDKDNNKIRYLIFLLTNDFHGKEFIKKFVKQRRDEK